MTTFEERLKETLSHTYDIERELGGGGMSRVFVAIDRSLGRKVVIKLLSPELIADVNRGRFRREIQVAAQLQHPHIVPLLSAGEHEDLVWYTMPFIAGESLRSAVEKHGPMSVPDVVRVMYHVGEALDYAHAEGVVHRDIKAANILRSGTYALVTDFGVAKALNASMGGSGMTQTGTAIGTPAYMAPEQLSGDPAADHRIDIYAVGLLAYELLNGRSPFAATTPAKVLLAVLSEEPRPLVDIRPDVPRSLSELVMRCLSKEPDERPATARAMLNGLDAFSTASGEIRTMEHKIPRGTPTAAAAVSAATGPAAVPVPTGPVAAPVTTGAASTPVTTGAASTPFTTGAASTPVTTGPAAIPYTPSLQPTVAMKAADVPRIEVEAPGYVPPKKDRTKPIAAAVAVLVVVTLVAFLLSQRTPTQSANVAPPPTNAALPAADSGVSMQPPPGAVPESTAQVAPVTAANDSAAIKDSLRRVARAEAAKKAAAKEDSLRKADSVKRVQTYLAAARANARRAAGAMLSNASARKAFTDGATHKGGILGSQRKGDLQTQINALTPWLRQVGLSYEQFKTIVAESGVKMYDEFGRMVPAAMQQFADGQ